LIDNFRVEEHLRSEEPFRTDRNFVGFILTWNDTLNEPIILLFKFFVVHSVVKILELFHKITILNYIGVFFLDHFGYLESLLDRDFFVSFSQHITNKGSHIAASKRNMFDAAVNDEPINNGYDMCDSIS
jgi:hypothetical protein